MNPQVELLDRVKDVSGKLCNAILQEARDKGYPNRRSDVFDDSWNPDAHVEITLTIEDLRNVFRLLQILDESAPSVPSVCPGGGR